MRLRRCLTLSLAVVLTALSAATLTAQSVSLTSLGAPSTQNFDTLSNTAGSTTNALTIPGWFMTETGGGARDNEQYGVDTGASTTGDTYSYGAAAATDRALGGLRSGTLIPNFGASFTNNTGSTITSLVVAYNGEEWRLGTAARTDQLNFEYSTNATDLTTGTWTNVTALNFVTPDTVTVGAKNGNAAADRTALSSTITGLSIPNGATFWIRWTDIDATSADDGLAVDDFSLTPQGAGDVTPPTVTSVSVPVNGTYITGQNLDFTVNFSETVNVIGTPRIPVTLNTGGTVFATYVSGTASTALLFRYQVAAGNADPDGITVGAALDPNGGSIKDGAGNDAVPALISVGSTTGVLVDGIAPSVSSSTVPANGTYVAGQNLDFTVTYDEAVVVTGTPSVALTLNTPGTVQAAYFSGSGSTTLTFRYTVAPGDSDSDGIGAAAVISLNGGTIKDAAGNNAATAVTFASTASVFVDAIAPAVSGSTVPANGTYISGQNLNFTVSYTEPVFVIGLPSVALTLNTPGTVQATYFSGSGSATLTFRYTVTAGDLDTDGIAAASSISLNGGSIKDAAGNNAATAVTFASTAGVLVDAVAPTVVSSTRVSSSPTSLASVSFTVTFDSPVTGVDTADFSLTTTGLTGTSVTNVSGSGTTYTVTASTGSGATGTLRLDVNNGASIQDLAGNLLAAGFTSGESYTIDRNAPSVQSIVHNDANPSRAASVTYTVTFTQNVTGVDSGDFTLTTTGVTGTSVSGVTGSGSTYVVTVNTGSGDGTIRLDLTNNGTIQSLTSVPLSGGFTTGDVYTIDKTPPAVQSSVRASSNPTTAASVNFTVTYSEPVSGVSAQDWALTTTGVTGASVTGFTGSGTTYTVTVNTGSGDGTIRLDVVTGGTVIDAAGNLLASGFALGESYTIDRTAPTVQSINRADANPTSAASVHYTVTFSEAVTGVDSGDFTPFATGVTGASVSGVTGSGTTYAVTVSTGSGDGTLRLDFTGSAADAAGNSAASFSAGQSYTIQHPPAAPTGLGATGGNNHVALTWNAVSGATSYNVKRSLTTLTGFTTIAPNVVPASYDDLSAVNGTAYFYKVSANNAAGEGADSGEATATPTAPPAAPSPVSIAVGDAKVVLSWPAVGGAASYNVKRGIISGNYTVTTNTVSPSFTDSTVTNGTPYFYVVTTVAAGESGPSSEVTGTPNTASVLGVVISQIYGGGGNAGATLKNDFVELFNRGTQTVSLAGWNVHYTSATGAAWNASNSPTPLTGTIAPGHYYLVQEGAGAAGTVNLPTPDATGTIAMGATGGKVALVGSSAALSVTCPTGSFIADFVGYGVMATNFCFEGTGPTAATSNTTAALRGSNGCVDTNNNASDFAIGAPNPRNSANPANICGIVNNPPAITPPGNPIASVAQDAAPFGVNLSGSDDGGVYQWTATTGTGVQSVSVTSGQGTPNVTYTVTLVTGFNGSATFTASLSDGVNPAVTQLVHIQVTGVGGNNPPIITPPLNPITTVAQDAPPFTVNVSGTDDGNVFNWSATPGSGVAAVSVSAGQGTATVTYTVTLNAGFSGTAGFTASLSDNVNPPATQLVSITVLSSGATPNHVVISQVYGGGGNSSATYKNDFIELYNPTASPVNLSGWSVQYAAATNTIFSGLQPIGGVIGPGEYYLIALASGGAVGIDLPPANVSGSINMSGTTGKVALVSNGDLLDGSTCTNTVTDPDLVDFVGYGGTANCNEGGTNAPAPSNTTSIFRKNSGNTDTNINGNDFITGAPNPRRTACICEIGPSIVNTDPNTNGTNVPRDGSIIITFSELVDVTPGWYSINCTISGPHNDATTVEGAPNTWVIIPNTNFQAGEQCSATVFKDFVHDRDTDDSSPGSDTLNADKTWSFTVSTGTAPPYPSNVHLTMGLPSACTADVLNPNNYLMQKPEMAICYSRDLGRPNWVSWHLTDEWVGSLTRVDTFRADPAVPPDWYRVLASDFFSSGFDRGHMTPNADRDKETSIPINQATFLMSNMVAQSPDNNQGPWANLENFLRTLLPANELYIVSGPFGTGGSGSNGGTTNTLANGHVTVPASTWKCALVLTKASGDDVARVTASTRTICVIMPNIQGIRSDDWHIYLKSVDQVEALTGYDLFSNVPSAIQASIEAGVDGTNLPGAGSQSVSTNEEAAKPITLTGASPTNGTITYTVDTLPTNGNLTGSGSSRTYTPAPDFNGTDSFTFHINDGTGNSNTATVSITVVPVNDPPTAADDSKTTTQDTPLTFPASDLTGNDSPGPANENSQTMTVTTVTSTGTTHGAVVLNSGQVTYTPASGYTGAASFTYTACDNGFTGASLDSKCATATVNVTINGCPPGPVPTAGASNSGPACTGGTVNLFGTGNGTVFAWTGPGGFTSSQQNPTGITVGGLYTVTVSTPGPCGGSAQASTTVVFNPLPSAAVTAEATACTLSTGHAASVPDAGVGATYTWSITNGTITAGAGTRSITYTAGTSGSVHLAVTVAAASCSANGTADVTITSSATATITTGGTACVLSPGNTASVPDAGVGAVYVWSITNGSITDGAGTRSITYTAGSSGSVHLAVAISSSGCGATGTADVAITSGPTITLPSTLSACNPTLLTVNFSLTGAGPWVVHWSDGINQSVPSSPWSRNVNAFSSMVLSVTSVSDANCTTPTSAGVAITIAGIPVIATQPVGQIVAPGHDATLSVAATGGTLHYQWFVRRPSGVTQPVGTDSPSFTTHPEGNAFWFVRITNGCGTVDSVAVTIMTETPRHHPSH